MTERALSCPKCNGPLPAARFSRTLVCPYCGTTVERGEPVVKAADFRAAFRAWEPASAGTMAVGGGRWVAEAFVARGDASDVYRGRRARWPTELVLIKVLRSAGDAPLLDHEWDVVRELHGMDGAGAAAYARLPQPVTHGPVEDGPHAGARATLFRWIPGFRHTLEDVGRAHPGGVEPRAVIWVWRRTLETLSLLHQAGIAHGAVWPSHLLVEDGEHGIRLVGFSRADRFGRRLAAVSARFEAFYPERALSTRTLGPAADLAMSARCMAALVGGDPRTGSVPDHVPAPLAALVRDVAAGRAEGGGAGEAWELRERLGALARDVFGPPRFCPLVMPA
jgi:hypothetical protein